MNTESGLQDYVAHELGPDSGRIVKPDRKAPEWLPNAGADDKQSTNRQDYKGHWNASPRDPARSASYHASGLTSEV